MSTTTSTARVEGGAREVTLLGQTVNSYKDSDGIDFADLLRAVGAVDGVKRLRFTSPHPNDFSPRVIGAMADTEAVCEHVHLPMQSGSSRVLKRMLRRYTREKYFECAADLRAAIGPSIGPCCYTVGPEVAQRFGMEGSERVQIDLALENERQLAAIGVNNIWRSGLCTFCTPGRFYSFRRDREETKRMISFVGSKRNG